MRPRNSRRSAQTDYPVKERGRAAVPLPVMGLPHHLGGGGGGGNEYAWRARLISNHGYRLETAKSPIVWYAFKNNGCDEKDS